MGGKGKFWVVGWVIDFYLVATREKIDTQEVYRAYAPTRWADNHVYRLKRLYQDADVTYSIERIG